MPVDFFVAEGRACEGQANNVATNNFSNIIWERFFFFQNRESHQGEACVDTRVDLDQIWETCIQILHMLSLLQI